MKVKVLEKKGDAISFVLDGATPAFSNALRRIMISEVPTLSVEEANITDNTSILFDEVLALRLGLLPLTFQAKRMNLPGECRCKGKGCPLCQVVLKLEGVGPKILYSGNLKSSNKAVKATDPKIPIVELLKGQGLKLEAVARLGLGKNHAKNHAANAAYQYYPELDQNQVKDKDRLKKAVQACPKGVLALRGSKIILKSATKCDICRSCEKYGIKIKGNPTKFIFRVESISGLSPKDIVIQAGEILQEKTKEFKKGLSKV